MSRAVAKRLWELSRRLWGDGHPATRARFGRYVASRGGSLTPRAGQPAYTAWYRAIKHLG